jgi:hypothetical protein
VVRLSRTSAASSARRDVTAPHHFFFVLADFSVQIQNSLLIRVKYKIRSVKVPRTMIGRSVAVKVTFTLKCQTLFYGALQKRWRSGPVKLTFPLRIFAGINKLFCICRQDFLAFISSNPSDTFHQGSPEGSESCPDIHNVGCPLQTARIWVVTLLDTWGRPHDRLNACFLLSMVLGREIRLLR